MLRIAGGRMGLEIFERFIRSKKKFPSILKQKFVDNVPTRRCAWYYELQRRCVDIV